MTEFLAAVSTGLLVFAFTVRWYRKQFAKYFRKAYDEGFAHGLGILQVEYEQVWQTGYRVGLGERKAASRPRGEYREAFLGGQD